MRKRRVKTFWFQIIAVEKRFGGDVYEYSFCKKTINANYASRIFWLEFSCDSGRVKGVEILSISPVKKWQEPTIKRLVDGQRLKGEETATPDATRPEGEG